MTLPNASNTSVTSPRVRLPDLRRLRRDPHIVMASMCSNLLSLALPLVMIQVYDRIIPREGYATMTVLAAGLASAALIDLLLRLARGRIMGSASARFEAEARAEVFRRLLSRDPALDGLDRGALHDRLDGVDRLRKHHGGEAATALLDLPFVLVFIAVLSLISPLLGLTVSTIALTAVGLVSIQRRAIGALTAQRQERDQRRHAFLTEAIEGAEMIRNLGIGDLMQRRYERLMSVNVGLTSALNGKVSLAQGITAAIGLMAPVVMAGVGSWLYIAGQMSVGAVAAAVLLTSRVIQPVLKIEALLAGEANLARTESQTRDLLSARTPRAGGLWLDRIDGISLDKVTLAPDGADQRGLREASLELRRGDCLWLTGDEGSGRSRLMSLLAGGGLLQSGTLRLNGRDSREIAPEVFADRVALLRADHTLLEGTLLENLCAFDIAGNRRKALALAEELGISEFIARHPEGLAMRVAAGQSGGLPTSIHDGAVLVSGLVRMPDVILFEEANAGLDRAVDTRLLGYLRRRLPDVITVIVSHRPSYTALANRVAELRDGRLVEILQGPADRKAAG